MKSDELTYLRAVRISIMGFAIQLVLAIVLLLYALFSVRGDVDHAALTLFLLAIGGLLPWLGLIIVHHQQKLAAIETLESERFSGPESGSVFEGEELRVAQRRLAVMFKFLFPTISLLLAFFLLAVGFWRFQDGRLHLPYTNYSPTDHAGWGIALGAIIGLTGYIFASFVAGMSNVKVWQNLRGGAGTIVGTALAAFALAVTLGIEMLSDDSGAARYMQVIIPVYMMILGAEIILNFLLNVYRPRARGEIPRPAFDSQILALVAQPQSVAKSVGSALSYQFGFEVGETWFYQLLSRTVTSLIVLALVVAWALSCLIVIEPNERAIVTRFGKIVRQEQVLDSGLHIKAPWPIERIERFEAMRIHEIQLSSQPDHDSGAPILWTNDHALNPNDFVIVAPSSFRGSADNSGDTGPGDAGAEEPFVRRDISLINAEVPLQYRIRDVMKFVKLAPQDARDDLLSYVAQRELMRYMVPLEVDEILGPARLRIGRDLMARIQAAYDELGPAGPDGVPLGAGVEVVFVGLSNVHPPKDVAASFQRVVQAQQEQVTSEEQGRSEEISALAAVAGSVEQAHLIVAALEDLRQLENDPAADPENLLTKELAIEQLIRQGGGEAATLINEAQAHRWNHVMREWALALEVKGRTIAFRAAPSLYMWREIFQILETSLLDTRLYINNTDAHVEYRINLETQDVLPSIEETPTGG
jgi:modulator of FtsH protease HflK